MTALPMLVIGNGCADRVSDVERGEVASCAYDHIECGASVSCTASSLK